MDALPLREVFAGLAGHDDAVALAGHEGLPEDLLIRAIGSYADTAPAEVAEHLSEFVAAPTDAQEGLHLLAAAPAGAWDGEVALAGDHDAPDVHELGGLTDLGNADSLDAPDHGPILHPGLHPGTGPAGDHPAAADPGHDSDFGHIAGGEAPDPSSEAFDHLEPDDATHVPLDDLSHEALDEHDAGLEPESHHAPDPTGEPEHDHHADDGHHDPGLDHFAG